MADPEHLPRWWPGVDRVEDASRDAWTAVLTSGKGKWLRADYTLLESEHPRRRKWRHEVEESPFERILSESVTEMELEPVDDGTRVTLTARLKPRGFSRFGGMQIRARHRAPAVRRPGRARGDLAAAGGAADAVVGVGRGRARLAAVRARAVAAGLAARGRARRAAGRARRPGLRAAARARAARGGALRARGGRGRRATCSTTTPPASAAPPGRSYPDLVRLRAGPPGACAGRGRAARGRRSRWPR